MKKSFTYSQIIPAAIAEHQPQIDERDTMLGLNVNEEDDCK